MFRGWGRQRRRRIRSRPGAFLRYMRVETYARPRSLRLSCGARISLRPRRARCRACSLTHVLLPAFAPPRSAYTMEVVGPALLGSAQGRSHRTIAADLGLPVDTVNLLLANALHFVVHIEIIEGVRRVSSVREVVDADGSRIVSNEVFRPGLDGRAVPGYPMRDVTLDLLEDVGYDTTLLDKPDGWWV